MATIPLQLGDSTLQCLDQDVYTQVSGYGNATEKLCYIWNMLQCNHVFVRLVILRLNDDTPYIQKKTNLCNPKILFIVFDLENLYPSLRLILCQPLGVPQF